VPDPTLGDVIGVLEALYPPSLAASWDAVGLVCGDPSEQVRRVLFAIDPVEAVADQAERLGADLIVTHHPLYLRGTSSVAATSAKGRLVHRLIRAGVALHVAHTNADHAQPGVSDALASALGLADLRPLDPLPASPLDKIVTFVPEADADKVLDALAAAGAGRLGDYSRCAWTASGVGTFLPEPGAHPAVGRVGDIERVDETRIEMVLDRGRRAEVVEALRASHPYEEPAFDLFELATWPGRAGTGRIGTLPDAMSLAEFAELVGRSLPATESGGRVAGDLTRPVRTVAVCGGAGDAYLRHASTSGADVYVTADLRHHIVSEHLADGGCAIVEMSHWATEWPWLPAAAAQLSAELERRGTTVSTEVSVLPTDPWTGRIAPPSGKEPR
jgi:dinuclear metal center YbgI/SA1388 family protein